MGQSYLVKKVKIKKLLFQKLLSKIIVEMSFIMSKKCRDVFIININKTILTRIKSHITFYLMLNKSPKYDIVLNKKQM